MKVLLDTSVLLDLLLNRAPWAADMAAIWTAHRQGRVEGLVAAFALPTIFYVVRRQTDQATAQAAVQHCLSTLSVAPVDQPALLAALGMPGPDFEDNLQIACAAQAGVDALVTRDPRGFAHSPLPVLTPADLVARLPGPNPP
jgi:predicted nucleic acid-binding protein